MKRLIARVTFAFDAISGLVARGLVVGAVPQWLGLAEQCNLGELPRVTGAPLLGAVPDGVGGWEPARFQAACAEWVPDAGWLVGTGVSAGSEAGRETAEQ